MDHYPLWRPVDLEKSPNRYADVLGMATKRIREFAADVDPTIVKAIDSVAGGPMIRQDLDPTIYKLFVRKFPLWDMIEKIPSNGLVHAYNQKTGFGDALFQTETGTVTDDASTYARATANIAVLATRRGVTLKEQYAVRQGGAPYDPEAEEIEGGLTALRHKAQVGIMRLQSTDATSTTATAANGLYDANAFLGLRYILQNVSPAANTVLVDETTNPTGTPITQALKAVSDAIIDQGGEPSLVFGGTQAVRYLDNEQLQFQRYINQNGTEIVPGLRVKEVDAGQALLPVLRVMGDSAGTYIIAAQTFIDLFVVDMSVVKWAYLGGATPTILEIPIGTDSKLQRLFIPFMMGGLVVNAPVFCGRVKIRIA